MVLNIKYSGSRKIFKCFVESAVFSIFAIVTNLSFFNVKSDKEEFSIRMFRKRERSLSLPAIHSAAISRFKSVSLPDISTEKENQEAQFTLSTFQSNLLYFFYFFGCAIFFSMDICYQYNRKHSLNYSSFTFFSIFLFNVYLWVDFNFSLRKRSHQGPSTGIIDELCTNSSDLLFCLIFAPIFLCISKSW